MLSARYPLALLALLWVWRVSRKQLTGRGGADKMVVAGVKDHECERNLVGN